MNNLPEGKYSRDYETAETERRLEQGILIAFVIGIIVGGALAVMLMSA